jgi:hypothetical protein
MDKMTSYRVHNPYRRAVYSRESTGHMDPYRRLPQGKFFVPPMNVGM